MIRTITVKEFLEGNYMSKKKELVVDAVIGAGYGDEGKGQVAYALLKRQENYGAVLRYSGGAQAGHTVYFEYNGKTYCHTFRHVGVGAIFGLPTIWASTCLVDFEELDKELVELHKIGINPTILIDPRCIIVTPLDKIANQRDLDMVTNGTCGMGIGTALQREQDHYHLQLQDLFTPKVAQVKLDYISTYYGGLWKEGMEDFASYCRNIFFKNFMGRFDGKYDQFGRILCEGSQGLMLDSEIGYFPHVTRARTGSAGIPKELHPYLINVTYVSRWYTTRHGRGPLAHLRHDYVHNPFDKNTFNEYQGDVRQGTLCLQTLGYAIDKDGLDANWKYRELQITCTDLSSEWDLIDTDNDHMTWEDDDDEYIDYIDRIILPDVGAFEFPNIKKHDVEVVV